MAGSPLPPTVADREAELAALQTAFDEYIASSRELEDELDAELAKMQDKLAQSSSANMALVAQLENVNPQLSSLERALAETKAKLEEESSLRRQVELAQDEAEARAREAEGSLEALRAECDDAHEQLAFKDEELEELRLELDIERERHRVEMEEVTAELLATQKRHTNNSDDSGIQAAVAKAKEAQPDSTTQNNNDDDNNTMGTFGTEDVNDDSNNNETYIRRLEDELEEVTEQLIQAEKQLADTEEELMDAQQTKDELETRIKILQQSIEFYEQENSEEKKSSTEENEMQKALQQQWLKEKTDIQEELALLNEELLLTQEELKAAEEDSKLASDAFDQYKARHADNLKKLQHQLELTKADSNTATLQVQELQKALMEATAETEALREEVDHLMQALENAQTDHDKALEELQVLKQAFDEAQVDAKQELYSLQKQLDEFQSLENTHTPKQLQLELEQTKQDLIASQRELVQANKLLLINTESTSRNHHNKPLPTLSRSLFHSRKRSSTEHDDNHDEFYRSHARSRSRTTHTCQSRGRSSSPTTVERLEYDSLRKSKKIKELTRKNDSLNEQNRMSSVSVKHLEEEVSKMQASILQVAAVPSSSAISSIDTRDDDHDDACGVEETIHTGDSELIAQEFRSLAKKSILQKEHNAQLLVKILKLQGNIQVCCRIRPMKISESQAGQKRVTEPLSETEVGCFDNRTQSWKSYAFDKVWGPDVSQQSVFRDVEPLALSVVDGYNACIFAYGQTGSGKTFTMEGSTETGELGISHRTIKKIFTLLDFRAQQQVATMAVHSRPDSSPTAAENSSKFVFSIQVGMMEIYNDEVYDLLVPQQQTSSRSSSMGKKPTLDIRRSKDGTIEVPGLEKESVSSLSDVMELLKRGNRNRAVAATNLNEHSSRSHMVLNVEVTSGIEGEPSNKGNLFLVDLAGSERVRKSAVQGQQLKEATHINKSLAALGNVMEALDRKASHVPYRDSKLTYLLQDCLGGNSRTMMVVTACPGSGSYDETQCALQFATRVRRIHLGSAQRNVSSKNLEETVKNLSSELKMVAKAKERADQQLMSLKRDHIRIQERLQASTEARSKSNDEARTMTVLRKNNNEITARWQKEKELRDQAINDLENCQKELKRVQHQLLKVQNERDDLTKEKIEKESELSAMTKELRAAKSASSAASHRARKAEALQSRKSSSVLTFPPRRSADEVRVEVLDILKKHDPTKVDKIDAIMERFQGRESLLLQKMTDRYGIKSSKKRETSSDHIKTTRSQLALSRHKERMKNRRTNEMDES